MNRSFLLLLAVAACSNGCAALTNPVADGIPVRRLPDEVFGQPKAELYPLPLNMLRITESGEYRLDKGDVLGIVADEVLTKENQPIPVQFIQNPNAPNPAVQGLPVTVQEDGTILLPLLKPIDVKGKTLVQVRSAIINEMEKVAQLVPEGKARVLVDLIQRRRYRVLVVREDSQPLVPQYAQGGSASALVGGTKRGAAFSLLLEPGRNDLLGALTQTGGMPGLEAKNEVVIRRGTYDPANPAKGTSASRCGSNGPAHHVHREGHHPDDDDTVFIEPGTPRSTTRPGCWAGPRSRRRDYDLRVIEAITHPRAAHQRRLLAERIRGEFHGCGDRQPEPQPRDRAAAAQLQQILIRVDLNEAFRDMRENIIILPGDVIVLQERPSEAVARYFTQTFRVNTTWEVIRGTRFLQTAISNNP